MSSTFTDLREHRAALMAALNSQGLHPIAMEQDAARPVTVLESSMEKVRDAAAYACVIGRRYGQMTPEGVSITELEFREAQRLGRPILVFLMGDDHPIRYADVETDPEVAAKLDRFREAVRGVGVYHEFNSIEEFRAAAVQSAAEVRRLLDASSPEPAPAPGDLDGIPRPPALYAEPPYIGSHEFVGRAAQLQTLNDWAAAAEPHPVLLFEAIGGTGKSMLTWEWTTRHATGARSDWAGIFWYSFYEKGAVMADFCRRALAYMTGRPLVQFSKVPPEELAFDLIRLLRIKPWLLIMDGLERVLVAYHRADAAQMADEEAGESGEIDTRDPCAAISPHDDSLLRELAGAGPSKVLISSRLVPLSLTSPARKPIPGVLHEVLPGLRPAEAEELLRSNGVRGDSGRIQAYLQSSCGCHPLVTGIVAGLVSDYLPSRGDFNAWEDDPAHGGHLNLAELDIVQKRNHILRSAIEALPSSARELLSTLAFLSESVDYATLLALSRHADEAELIRTVQELERRGLLQYDRNASRYDLHPVVRGVAIGILRQVDRDVLGARAVDFFSIRGYVDFFGAESRDDLSDALTVVRVLLQMRDLSRAAEQLDDGLLVALVLNIEAYAETVSLLRPFFRADWSDFALPLSPVQRAKFPSTATIAFNRLGQPARALRACGLHITSMLRDRAPNEVVIGLHNAASALNQMNRPADDDRIAALMVRLAAATGAPRLIFLARLTRFEQFAQWGADASAMQEWEILDPMGRSWPRSDYRQGRAEVAKCRWDFWTGRLEDPQMQATLRLVEEGNNRLGLRDAHQLHGEWRASLADWEGAAAAYSSAVLLARQAGHREVCSEVGLALARFHLGQEVAAREDAARMQGLSGRALRFAAQLWRVLGDHSKATALALDAYRWAWADGEPFVRRYELDQCASLLAELGVPVPRLPAFDPARLGEFSWEADVRELIAVLEAEHQDAR